MFYVVQTLGKTDIFHFRRDVEDSDWIRILTMLGLSAELYNDLTQENINNNCPSKLICQAFESRDFLGFTFPEACLTISTSPMVFILGQEDSYIRKIYQLFTSLQFQTGGGLEDNQLTVRICLSLFSFSDLSIFPGRKF